MKYSIEYCSLHYLNMWLKHDKKYHESINGVKREERLSAIDGAAKYYKVARNFPIKSENGRVRYERILKIIDKVVASEFYGDTVSSVEKVESKIRGVYKGGSVLSATTKLLWLKIRNPIIIYDSQARKALNAKDGDFSDFYEKWHAAYEKDKEPIASACSKLSRISRYSCDQTIATKDYVKTISAQPWFQERVFDVYLWHKGL